MDLTLFFTWGVSLGTWDDAGMLEREVAIYGKLVEKGATVSFVTYGGGGETDYAGRLPDIRVLSNRWHLPLKLYARLIPRLHAQDLRRTDVVKSNQVAGAETALAAARRFGKKFIARCGYLPSEFARHSHGQGSKEVTAARTLERRVFTGADRVVVTTEAMRRIVLDEYGIDGERVRVIPNYVDTDLFRPARERPAGKRICFIGRLVEQKNLFALVEALEGLDVELVIIGDGHLRRPLEEEARRRGLSATFLGSRPHAELAEILNGSLMFVLPSHYEGHPKVLLEAMSCGLPVVGADVPGICEVVRHMENGYLCDPRPESIRRAVTALLGDPALRGRLGNEARRFVVENCSLDRIVEEERVLIEGLLGELAHAS